MVCAGASWGSVGAKDVKEVEANGTPMSELVSVLALSSPLLPLPLELALSNCNKH